ncbi:MAG: extensin family protein [Pseudomonadota bacterium]
MARRARAAVAAAALCLAPLLASAPDAGAKPAYGPLCGDPKIRGYVIDGFDDGGGCMIANPVAVAEIAGVSLSPLAVLNCQMAQSVAAWVETAAKPAARALMKAELAEITHVSAYVCRRRNSRASGRLSLHATGDALDFAAFAFKGGARVEVRSGWDGTDAAGAAFLREIWRSACGPFSTVLGPESDVFHRDHFHVDIAPRRAPYCR